MTASEVTFRSDVTVTLVRASGDDAGICEAARVSTLAEMAAQPPDTTRNSGLINYLMRDRHGSPFEHNSMTFMITAPIFVFREFHRHRVGWSYNEASGRYMELEPVFYIPGEDRNLVQEGKPGKYEYVPGTPEQYLTMEHSLTVIYRAAYSHYRQMLAAGIAREVARSVLPVGLYSSMYATCNARSLLHFLSLRTHRDYAAFPSHPQREIEMVAEQMEGHLTRLFPLTWTAYNAQGRVAP